MIVYYTLGLHTDNGGIQTDKGDYRDTRGDYRKPCLDYRGIGRDYRHWRGRYGGTNMYSRQICVVDKHV